MRVGVDAHVIPRVNTLSEVSDKCGVSCWLQRLITDKQCNERDNCEQTKRGTPLSMRTRPFGGSLSCSELNWFTPFTHLVNGMMRLRWEFPKSETKRLIFTILLLSRVLWLYDPGVRLMSAARCVYTSAVFKEQKVKKKKEKKPLTTFVMLR